MNITILSKSDYITSNWSGGSTTQLFISPATASYAERNFDFRISSAKVEVAASTFTQLPNINRKLMVLEGEITVTHENHHSKTLKQFDTDTFSGDWKTTAIGTCTDFNLMTKECINSELSYLSLEANQSKNIELDNTFDTVCFYLHSGSLIAEINSKMYELKKESLLVLTNVSNCSFLLRAHKRSNVIISKISH
ncbi:MAG: HutD family protein [Flavobacteriales bacterium]|nr:HutD family protein [Flavobacteriales bacterium]MCB9174088.1 HutD family protein [Flavobacteriales bacterium]